MSNFLFDELSSFKQDLLRDVQKNFPEEMNDFIKQEAQELKKEVQKVANSNVNKGDAHYRTDKKGRKKSTNYHKNFKIGKKYERGDNKCIRVFNSARHAHLIEYGHVSANKYGENGFVTGKFVFKEAEINFSPQFKDDAEKFLYEFFDKTTSD